MKNEQSKYNGLMASADAGFQEAYRSLADRQESKRATAPTDSPTQGMNLGERIAHVGGRINEQGYVEFGSAMAVDALIQHVLRDMQGLRQKDAEGDLQGQISGLLMELAHKDLAGALSIATGVFVSLTLAAMRGAGHGHSVDGDIRINGGDQRDITIHAAKVAARSKREDS